jgi:hypothetical protein
MDDGDRVARVNLERAQVVVGLCERPALLDEVLYRFEMEARRLPIPWEEVLTGSGLVEHVIPSRRPLTTKARSSTGS